MSEQNTPPLPGHEGRPVAALRHRGRSFGEEEPPRPIAYDKAHGGRTRVLAVLVDRREALEEGAAPSGGDQGLQPEAAPPPRGRRSGTERAAGGRCRTAGTVRSSGDGSTGPRTVFPPHPVRRTPVRTRDGTAGRAVERSTAERDR